MKTSRRWIVPIADGVRRLAVPPEEPSWDHDLAEVRWSPDGCRVACLRWGLCNEDGAAQGRVDVLDAQRGEATHALEGPGIARKIEWLAEELLLVTRETESGWRLFLHELPDGGVVRELALPCEARTSHLADNGRCLVVAPDENTLVLVALPGFEQITRHDLFDLVCRDAYAAKYGPTSYALDHEARRLALHLGEEEDREAPVVILDLARAPSDPRRAAFVEGLPRTTWSLEWFSRTRLLVVPHGVLNALFLIDVEDDRGPTVLARYDAPEPVLAIRGPNVESSCFRASHDVARNRLLVGWESVESVWELDQSTTLSRWLHRIDLTTGASTCVALGAVGWRGDALVDPTREDGALVARAIDGAVRIDRVDFASGEVTAIAEHASQRGVRHFELLPRDQGLLIATYKSPRGIDWIHVDAARLTR